MPDAQRAGDRALLDGGGKSGRNSNHDMELRSHRVLLDGAGVSRPISMSRNELQRHRVLLDGATTRVLPATSGAIETLALSESGVSLAATALRVGMLLPPLSVLARPGSEVARMTGHPRGLSGRLARPLARRRAARDLARADPRIHDEPPTAVPTGTLPRPRCHRARLLAKPTTTHGCKETAKETAREARNEEGDVRQEGQDFNEEKGTVSDRRFQADSVRDMEPPYPSRIRLHLTIDARTPWRAVRRVFEAATDPRVLIRDVVWTVRLASEAPDRILEVPLPAAPVRPGVRIGVAPGDGEKGIKITLQSEKTPLESGFPAGAAGVARLEQALCALSEGERKGWVQVDASDCVPFGEIVRVVDTIRVAKIDHLSFALAR